MTGRVYRACGCRDSNGKQLGAKCLTLATNKKHGTWYYAVRVDRKTLRKGGFTSKAIASAELKSVVGRVEAGVKLDPKQTTGHYLLEWLASRRHDLAPKTAHQYRMYIDKDIVPALGKITLEQLHHEHVERMVSELEKAGRGATTITRIIACLSSALSDGVKRHRISHNVAQYVTTPKTASAERAIWTATQAIMFLEAAESDRLAPFFETIIGTGLRRGEAMGLRWTDVDIDRAALRVRQSISEVGGKLTFGPTQDCRVRSWRRSIRAGACCAGGTAGRPGGRAGPVGHGLRRPRPGVRPPGRGAASAALHLGEVPCDQRQGWTSSRPHSRSPPPGSNAYDLVGRSAPAGVEDAPALPYRHHS